jgi:Tfp pilus assembly major pilin PilA
MRVLADIMGVYYSTLVVASFYLTLTAKVHPGHTAIVGCVTCDPSAN